MAPAMPILDNTLARRVFLHRHMLGQPPQGPGKGVDLLQLIRDLGFVQVDSVQTVARAHHMILLARRPAYRPHHLTPLLERDRSLFEHWTHDAAIVPAEFYPHWRLRFARDAQKLPARWSGWQGDDYLAELDRILAHVRAHGEVCAADLHDDPRPAGEPGWWNWHPSKTALEYLWRAGQLSIARRQGFRKQYDLPERVLPEAARHPHPTAQESIDWLNAAALDRLGFATSGEIAAFWAHVTPAEAAAWCADERAAGRLEEVSLLCADGRTRKVLARPGLLEEAATLAPAPGRIRVLSPFDPALRDRNRAERLFGFVYRIEIFVPAPKRQYGYYVFPLLEGERLIGRIDMKVQRETSTLEVARLWLEPGVQASKGRMARLEAELGRVARFAGCEAITYAPGWIAES